MNRNLGISTGLIALFALIFHISPMGSDQRGAGVESQTAAKTGRGTKGGDLDTPDPDGMVWEGPWLATRIIRGPFDDQESVPPLRKNPKCSTDSPPAECFKQGADLFGLSGIPDIETVLATVPDPLHTRLALVTDGALDAIENSATEAGWVFAAQWLPWLDPIDPEVKDPTKRRRQRMTAREQESEPGVLVFRREVDQSTTPPKFESRLLLVFVVGETPTGGINRAQYRNARAYMRIVGICRREVLLLGPSFSGSFQSLAELTQEDSGSRYVIRSGIASSVNDAKALQTNERTRDFNGVNLSSDDFRTFFGEALDALHIPRDRAAILIEDETRFGTSVSESVASVASTAGSESTSKNQKGVGLTLRFPRDISQLRNAYHENKSLMGQKGLPPELDFSLKDSELGEDSIPSYSKSQGPLSQDARLEEAVDAIRRDQIRAVEIIATNALDALFLARVLQTKSPDTRIILPYANLLFVEAARTESLRNMLALSSYPLFEERRYWGDLRARVTHPDSISEGVYNAMLLLLHKIDALGGYSLANTLDDYGWRERKDLGQRHPPVWFLTVDREGFLPIRAWLHDKKLETHENWWETVDFPPDFSKEPERLLYRSTQIWSFVAELAGVAGLGGMVFSLVLWKGNPRWDGRFLPMVINGKDQWRLFYLIHFFLLLAAMQAVLCLPWLTFPKTPRFVYWGLCEASIVGLFAMSLIVQLFRFKRPVLQAAAFLAVIVLTLIGYGWGLRIWRDACRLPDDSAGMFFSLRAIELRIGSSPALPILAALFALALFCHVHLNRIYLAACQEPSVIKGLKSALQSRIDKSSRSLSVHFGSPFGLVEGKEWTCLVGGVGLACGLGFSFNRYNLATMDGWPFNYLLVSLQGLVAAALVHSCIQMVRLWLNLKSFLAGLGTLPLATAFIARSRTRSARPIWVQNLNLQSLSTLVRGPTVLHDISLKADDEIKQMFDDYVFAIRRLIEEPPEEELEPPSRIELIERSDEVSVRNTEIARTLFTTMIRPHWLRTPLVGRMEADLRPAGSEREPAGKVGIWGDPGKLSDLAQAFVALHFTPFLLYCVRQIQNLVSFLSLGFVALAISMNADSPQSPQLVSRFLLVAFSVIAVVMWRCLAGIERDPIISRIEGTKAGELNADFYLKLIGYGALPAIGLLASEFPSIANFLFSWIEPTLAALR